MLKTYLSYFFVIIVSFSYVACNKVDVDYSASSLNNLRFKLVGENSSNNEIRLFRNQVYTIDYRKKDKIKSDLKIKFEYSLIDNTKWKVSDILSDYKTEDTLSSADELLKFRMQVQSTLPTNEFMNLKVKFTAEDDSIEFVPSELVIKIDNSTQPPTAVTITSPPNNSYINVSNQSNFEITGTCAAGNTVELSSASPQTVVLFPGPLPCVGGSFTTGLMDVSGFFDGAVTIDVKQKNQLSEVSPVSSLNLSKDTVLPNLAISSHTNNAIIDTSSITTFTVSGTCSESGAEVKILGDLVSSPNPLCSAGSWSTTLDAAGLVDGNFNLIFKHYDLAGNVNASLTRTLIKSSSGIVAALSSLSSAFTNQNTFSFNVGGPGIVSYKYALGKGISCSSATYSNEYSIGSPITKMTDPGTGALTTSTLSSGDGTYVICVIGKNSSNAFQSVSSATSYAWVYDNTLPVVGTIDDAVYFNSATSTPTITWSGISDATSGIDNYYIAIGTFSGGYDVLGWTPIGIVPSYSTSLVLNYGTRYYATLNIKDKAGNSKLLYGDGWWAVQPMVISPSNISLITGETFSIGSLISGGLSAYVGSSSSGFLNSSSLIYSVPLTAAPVVENVTIADSAGQNAVMSVQVRAFQDKLLDYAFQGNIGEITVNDLKKNPISGYFYSANSEISSSGYWTWVVKKSTDNGTTWNPVDIFSLDGDSISDAKSIAFDASGNIYVAGSASDRQGSYHWMIRKSTDDGNTWSTILDFQAEAGYMASAKGIIISGFGKILTVGSAYDSSSGAGSKWLVLQLNTDGSGLNVLNSYFQSTGYTAIAESITEDSSNNLYVSGSASSAMGTSWTVRKSSDGGATWTNVDSYRPATGYFFTSKKIKVDNLGNIYAVGFGSFGLPYSSCLVRVSSDGGSTWNVSDQYNPYSGKNCTAFNLEMDSSSNVYVTASALDFSNVTNLFVRKYNGSWSTKTQYNLSSAFGSGQLTGIAIDGTTISVAGYSYDASSKVKMVFLQSNDSGNTWPTSNQYINELRPPNEVNDLMEFSGNLFIGGYQKDSNFVQTWHLKKSTDGGATWNTSEIYNLVTLKSSSINALAGNSTYNSLFSVGFAEDNSSIPHWIVRKSSDSGSSWSISDDFSFQVGYASRANASYVDANGKLYVVGESQVSSYDQKWMVRRSSDNGVTWNNLDIYNTSGFKASALAINQSAGNIVVAGYDEQAAGIKATIRYSSDGGATWVLGDQFVYATGKPAMYKTMTRDNLGNLYVSGHVEDFSGVAKWFIKKSTNGGANWATIVNSSFIAGKNSEIHKLSADTNGNIYAAGEYTAGDNTRYWVLRKSSDYGTSWVTIDKKQVFEANPSTFKAFTPCLTDRLCSGISIEESFYKGKKWLVRILSP